MKFSPAMLGLIVLAVAGPSRAADSKATPLSAKSFSAAPESLQQYRAPDWFRDAKFGIWSHWGPQAVPRQGDWYARNMYREGERQYRHHLSTYGHPSKHGYKDIIPLWKAEKWEPDALMALYARAGAKYFVSMGVHHDNFDLWNSKCHAWNAVNMGPRRDVVGEWKSAAKKRGLRFGVSEHLGASYTWFQTSRGSDRNGPLAGVAYDGADPKYSGLYHLPTGADDRGWYSNNPAAMRNWTQRISDLLDNYQPDLLYSDGGIPFGEVGRTLIAHFYNCNRKRHGGRLDAVYTYKNIGSGEFIPGAGVLDVERGALQGISPQPWQTDTSIGDWFYSDNYRYKTTGQVIHSLADVVSKNGNLLINVVQYPDGSLPPESLHFLQEMGDWMPVNGEAIFKTRPWTIFGEGPTRARSGNFNENTAFTAQDIRFTTKNEVIYAITLGVPTQQVVIKSLAAGSPFVSGKPASVRMLGHKTNLPWTRSAEGLVVQLPTTPKSKHAISLKISGLTTISNLAPDVLEPWTNRLQNRVVKPASEIQTVAPDADGTLRLLPASALLSEELRVEGPASTPNIGHWSNFEGSALWQAKISAPGIYRVAMEIAANEATDFIVEIGGRQLPGRSIPTGDWNTYQTIEVGDVEISQAGTLAVKIRSASPATWRAFNLRWVHIIPRS